MDKEFYIMRTGGGEHARRLDVSAFSSLEQLTKALANVFAFADAKGLWLFDKHRNQLKTLQEVQASDSGIELRGTRDESVREPPGPRALPVVGNRYELYPDVLGNYDRLFARYGPMIKTVNMGTATYHTNDPAIARHLLREDELFTKSTSAPSHPLHYMADQSALFTCDSASPAFVPSHQFVPPTMSPKAVAHYMPLIQEATQSVFQAFDAFAESDKAVNVYQQMFKLASEIIWRVVLNQKLDHFATPQTPPSYPIRLFGEYLALMKKLSMLPQWLRYLPFGAPARLKEVRQIMLGIVEDAMRETVDPNSPPISLSDPGAIQSANCIADFLARAQDANGKSLSEDLVRSNVLVTTGAGFTTSSSLLSWALYALVHYPGNQARLLEEITRHRHGEANKRWTYDELHSLEFLDAFVKEVLRLHSPSFQTARNAKQDAVLPGGYLIPKGSIVIACFPSIHKHPDHWDNPLRFEPDRWMQNDGLAARKTRQGAYTPFAAGGRGCIGFNLALTQVKVVLAELVYRYEFEDNSPEAVVYDPEFLVTRPLNFYAAMTRRTVWPDLTKGEDKQGELGVGESLKSNV